MYEEEYNERLQPERSRITSFVLRVCEREKDMHDWIEWIIMQNLPLSIADCPMTCRAGVRWKPICSKQLRKQIDTLALQTNQQKNSTDAWYCKTVRKS